MNVAESFAIGQPIALAGFAWRTYSLADETRMEQAARPNPPATRSTKSELGTTARDQLGARRDSTHRFCHISW